MIDMSWPVLFGRRRFAKVVYQGKRRAFSAVLIDLFKAHGLELKK